MPFESNFQILFMNYMTMKDMIQMFNSKKESYFSYKTEPSIKDSGLSKLIRDMGKATKFGQMEAYMKVIGRTIKLMGEEDLFMPTETYMMDIGRMIKLTALDNILIQTVLSMKANGVMTSSMVKEKKNGLTVQNTREITISAKSMASVNSTGQITRHILVTLSTTISKVTVNIAGPTEESTQEIGFAIRCTVKESLHGRIRGDTRVHITMTRNRATEYSFGLMAENTMVTGRMVNKRESEFTKMRRVKISMDSGRMANVPNGLQNLNIESC